MVKQSEEKRLTKNAMAHLLRSAASALDHGRMATARVKVSEVYTTICVPALTLHTPNGYDPRLIEVLNTILEERETGITITDIEPHLWDKYIGPLCDELEGIEVSDNPHDHDEHDASCNGMSPCDMVTEKEDDDA